MFSNNKTWNESAFNLKGTVTGRHVTMPLEGKIYVESKLMDDDKIEVGPSSAGSLHAYEAQYREFGGEWVEIPRSSLPSGVGIPYPSYCADLLKFNGLMGYEQAKAIEWSFRSMAASNNKQLYETRVIKFNLKYDFDAEFIGVVE